MNLRDLSVKQIAEAIAIRGTANMPDLDKIEIDVENPDACLYEVKENSFGNLDISLFWEEKIILMIRYLQFYGFYLLIFYEDQPEQYRWYSRQIFLASGLWNLAWPYPINHLDYGWVERELEDQSWYDMIKDAEHMFWAFTYNYAVLLFFMLVGVLIFTIKPLNLKLVMCTRKCNVFKAWMWIIEII